MSNGGARGLGVARLCTHCLAASPGEVSRPAVSVPYRRLTASLVGALVECGWGGAGYGATGRERDRLGWAL